MKNTVATLQQQKLDGDKITMLTAYDYSTAKLVDECGVNTILVGDSLGMVMLGYEDTISVTMEDMIHHTAAVTRGAKNALVVGDMPFMSYQTSVYDAVVNAGRLMKEGRCQAVKLEGGASVCPQIKAITEASIPVVAHIGLTPQSVNAFGGFKVQGKSEADARRLIEEAKAVEAAGAFAIVLECIPAKLAKLITESVSIPTIGIGAGADCDGQVLVYQDMLALFSDFKPKFVKHFANAGEVMKQGFTDYIKEVKEGTFPAAEHTFKIADDIINKLYIYGANHENRKNYLRSQSSSEGMESRGAFRWIVPTMGFLHEGHKSLIDRAVKWKMNRVVVSDFVNPTQFGPTEDLASYPRDLERDATLCENAGRCASFNPEPSEMYARMRVPLWI